MNRFRFWHMRFWLAAAASLLLAACAATAISNQNLPLPEQDKFAVLPITNATEVPQAQDRVQAIVVALLRQKGLQHVLVYPQPLADNPLEIQPAVTNTQARDWARSQGARYALSGTVTEWRYKTGVDNEPAVGLALEITDLASGQVECSATGARSGWGYQALAAVGQAQISDLLRGLQVQAVQPKPASKQ
jgi:TolB-like protein